MSNDDGASAIQRRGLMLVLSSPSGAGKTTLSRQLLDNDKQIQLSVSCTTRPKRPGETRRRRLSLRRHGDLPRHDRARASSSNTPRCSATTTARRARRSTTALASGRDVLFDIDWQGTQQLRSKGRGRPGHGLHPAAVDARPREAPADTRAQDSPGDRRPAHGQGGRRDEPLGRVRLRRRQPRHRHQPDRT